MNHTHSTTLKGVLQTNRVIALASAVALIAAAGPGTSAQYLGWGPQPQMSGDVGEAVTVESGQVLQYALQATDLDSAYIWDDNDTPNNPDDDLYVEDAGTFGDTPFWVNDPDTPKPDIESSMGGWEVWHIAGPNNGVNEWEFEGYALPMHEEPETCHDHWWFDDWAQIQPPDEGNRNDDQVGPYTKSVNITPSHGWIFGHVTSDGDPAYGATVEAWREGTYLCGSAETNEDGYYEIHCLEPDTYTVKAYLMTTGEAQAQVDKGEGALADIALPRPPGPPGP